MQHFEQVKEVTTPEEMRAEIFRLQHYDALVRNVMEAANYGGLSAEDRYTILAYHALCAKNDALSRMIEIANTSARSQIFMQNAAG